MNAAWTDAFHLAPALKVLRLNTDPSIRDWIEAGYIRVIAENPCLEEIRCYGTLGKNKYFVEPGQKAGLPQRIQNLFTFIKTESDRHWCVSGPNLLQRKIIKTWSG
jgi:hypothetical protein